MSPWIKLFMKADTLRFLSYIKQYEFPSELSQICLSARHLLCNNTSPNTITVLHPTHFTHLCFLPDFCRIWVQSFYILHMCPHINANMSFQSSKVFSDHWISVFSLILLSVPCTTTLSVTHKHLSVINHEPKAATHFACPVCLFSPLLVGNQLSLQKST